MISGYLRFCKAIGLETPIWMFSTLVGCEGVLIRTDMGFRDLSDHAIDRSPLNFPEVEIQSPDAETIARLLPWCDIFWQACGIELAFNFRQQSQRRQRRR